jgi:hypothetical protein
LRSIDILLALFYLAAVMSACAEKSVQTSDNGPESDSSLIGAMPIGAAASAIVELGDMYRAPETYDVKITVLEILRGEGSMHLIDESHVSHAPAGNDFEYVLARIRFEYSARGAPGDKTWDLDGGQFNAFSDDGRLYGNPSIVLPEQRLGGVLHSGDSRQGWIAFEVAGQDKKPLMNFGPGNVWFQLY